MTSFDTEITELLSLFGGRYHAAKSGADVDGEAELQRALAAIKQAIDATVDSAEAEWRTQGRTEEQQWAVRNFKTGSLSTAFGLENSIGS